MKNIYIESIHDNGDKWWKFLCVTMDNEALGFLERLLTANGVVFKIESRG